MGPKKTSPGEGSTEAFVAEVRKEQLERERGYREQALKMYPWICGRCGRAFEGKRLRELTVHHRDHNHDNNPADGSNWELLCLYCHANEHERNKVADAYGAEGPAEIAPPTLKHSAFSDLESLLKKKK